MSILGLLLTAAVTSSATLSLDDALKLAARNHPLVRDARASVEAARARIDQSKAGLYPQLSGDASYSRSTSSRNSLSFGLSANQLIWDFNRTARGVDAAKANARAEEENEKSTYLDLALGVRTLYFSARAQKALITVARETLANQERHFQQISGFIEVGTRPAIDLAQTKTDMANARVQLVNAEADYESTKAALNRAIGVEGSLEYDVEDRAIGMIEGEDAALEALLAEAVKTRPELAAIDQRMRAQEAVLSSIRARYWPTLFASASANESGRAIDERVFDADGEGFDFEARVGVVLSWSIFEGGAVRAQVRESEASLEQLRAQADALRQEVRLELSQVRAALRGAKAALGASDEAVESARVRLTLAEGRYETGVGNIIELADAQLALTAAEAQRVQADFNLATARARLIKALGRP
jgi:outer membrane protein